jgi:phage terminase large subunit
MILTPTIRERDSEIWLTINPDSPDAPVQEQFVDGQRPDTKHVHVTYVDNPWFPSVLESEREYLQRVNPDDYAYVWLGATRAHSDAQVFKGRYSIEAFEPVLPPPPGHWIDPSKPKPFDGPYFGVDFGYANDPSTMVKMWIDGRILYVQQEAYGIGVEIDNLPRLFDSVVDASTHASRADCARPETISFLQRHGYPRMVAAKKGPGSVEDGIEHLRSYERIVVHPRCTHVAAEMRLYSYKVDRLTGDVLPQLVEKNDHCVDAMRYGIEPAIRKRRNARIVPLRI